MPPILHNWICERHRIRDSVIWETTQGAQSYPHWPQERINDLQVAFNAAWNSSSTQLNDPPSNILHPGDNSAPTTALSHANARSLYLASVGQSLAVEIDNRVGWSVANYSNDNLAILFDSREFFVWSASDNGYEIQDLKGGYVVPASPHRMQRFLKDNDLIGEHRHETVVRMLKWCHHNLSHNIGGHTTKTYHDVWQYRGEAPVLRTIEGTKDHANPSYGIRHWTAGCHGTAGFLRAILRTVNIPVVHDHQCGHALPYFSADGLHLSHGDDPYNGYTFADPQYSMSELLLDQTKFDSSFGSGVSEDAKCKHIGKRTQELAIQHLPTEMLRDYCNDQALGKSHTDGAVAANMPAYTVAQLEAHHLWSRMDDKIATMGGCDHVPYS